ncbi:hypothetical protein LCGC14_0471640 [marine sediment metagenome]|uniref:Uncharacterized protein n=1 Tax=marine sediment metagenome TaxID=412755 RepID=A0A0F9SUX8_9ZZZZ|nr:MAG: hypothetical protein Lokiarch_25370 [Candidatus Lokiarchaeum sp. GC14_75]HEC37607.1 hypothetical protein [bacterium]
MPIKTTLKEEKKSTNWHNTMAKLDLLGSKCSNCGEPLVDTTEIILRERKERAKGTWSRRRQQLPKNMNAYCENRACQLRHLNISFQELILLKDVAKLKKGYAELEKKQQWFLQILEKSGVISEESEIQKVDKNKIGVD